VNPQGIFPYPPAASSRVQSLAIGTPPKKRQESFLFYSIPATLICPVISSLDVDRKTELWCLSVIPGGSILRSAGDHIVPNPRLSPAQIFLNHLRGTLTPRLSPLRF